MMVIRGRLIYLLTSTNGIVYRNFHFYNVNLKSGTEELLGSLLVSGIKSIIGYSRLCSRILRLEPKCAARIDDDRFVVSVLGKLWLLDIGKKNVMELCSVRSGYNVLNFCERGGFLYWGDYGANPNYDEINIYELNQNLHISIVHSFPRHSIRHIHNIIKDGDGFIVMAGDNEKMAGIYRANGEWTEVKPWKCGEQKYRAVVGFAYKGGLLYATDSVEKENHLRFINSNGEEKILMTMNGSCIYGGESKEHYLFSTTVESPEGGGKLGMLSRKLGGGIKSDEVFVIAVAKEDLSIKEIGKFKKDFWPMKLMQYGQAFFAGGQENEDNEIWCSPISCVHFDGKSVPLRINE